MTYNWQQSDWPNFTFDLQALSSLLDRFAKEAIFFSGILRALPEEIGREALIYALLEEAIKTSKIEGEYLSRADVMSSIQNNLGLFPPSEVKDKRATGIVNLLVDLPQTIGVPLTHEKLFSWHRLLFEYLGGVGKFSLGCYRTHVDPMRVVSGPIGREKIHFEAPPSRDVLNQMDLFLSWFNDPPSYSDDTTCNAALVSGVSHLYFESIHPFEDGNGRIGRALSDLALVRALGRPSFLTLSHTIEGNKSAYYKALETFQRGNVITGWLEYFLGVLCEAQHQCRKKVEFTLEKTRFFDTYGSRLNERQEKVINRMLLDMPEKSFEGGINARKYVSLTSTSKATATRDLQHLERIGVLKRIGSGRAVRYELVLGESFKEKSK